MHQDTGTDREPTRAELIEALTNLSFAAQREFPVVGTYRAPTPWDRRHQRINTILDQLDMLTELEAMERT